MHIPATAKRVPQNTSREINERIERRTRMRIRWYEDHPEQIDTRLRELDHEWSTERVLETNAGTLACTGAVLALTVDTKWALLPAIVGGFLAQHGVQGWCPPLPVIRAMGYRTPQEIEAERYALLDIKGRPPLSAWPAARSRSNDRRA